MTKHIHLFCSWLKNLQGCIETHLDVTGNVDLAVIRELERIYCREEKEVGTGLGQTLGGLPPVTNQLGFSGRDFINIQHSSVQICTIPIPIPISIPIPKLTLDSRPYQ